MTVEPTIVVEVENDYYCEEIISNFEEGLKILDEYLQVNSNKEFQTCKEKMIEF